LEQDFSNNRVVGGVKTERLQSTETVCTDKVVTSWLAATEKKSLVRSIQFGGEDAVKTMKAVERLAVVYKALAADSWRSNPSVCTAVWSG
jgi:hypothetical protein